MYIVPMQPINNHKFSAKIFIDGTNTLLKFKLMYNEIGQFWSLDIAVNDDTKAVGVPLIPAQNLLEQLGYLGIGSIYIVKRSQIAEQWASEDTLNSDWYILWGDSA